MNSTLSSRFKNALDQCGAEAVPELQSRIDVFLSGKDFPIDYRTGQFSQAALDIAKDLKSTPQDLFGFDEARYSESIAQMQPPQSIVFRLHVLGDDTIKIAQTCKFEVCKVDRLLQVAKDHIAHFCEGLHGHRIAPRSHIRPVQPSHFAAKAKLATDRQQFMDTGVLKDDHKFLAQFSHLSVGRQRTKPEIFLAAFEHFVSIRGNKAAIDYPKREIVHIFDQQVLTEGLEIRRDFTPDQLGGLFDVYSRLHLDPSRLMLQAIEKIVQSEMSKESKPFTEVLQRHASLRSVLPDVQNPQQMGLSP